MVDQTYPISLHSAKYDMKQFASENLQLHETPLAAREFLELYSKNNGIDLVILTAIYNSLINEIAQSAMIK